MLWLLRLLGFRHSLARRAYVHRLGHGRFGPVFVLRDDLEPLPVPKTHIPKGAETARPLRKLPPRTERIVVPFPMPLAAAAPTDRPAIRVVPIPVDTPTAEPVTLALDAPYLPGAFTALHRPAPLDPVTLAAAFDRSVAERIRPEVRGVPAEPTTVVPLRARRRAEEPMVDVREPATAAAAAAGGTAPDHTDPLLTPTGLRRRPLPPRSRRGYHQRPNA